jgi:hypothetical protein
MNPASWNRSRNLPHYIGQHLLLSKNMCFWWWAILELTLGSWSIKRADARAVNMKLAHYRASLSILTFSDREPVNRPE